MPDHIFNASGLGHVIYSYMARYPSTLKHDTTSPPKQSTPSPSRYMSPCRRRGIIDGSAWCDQYGSVTTAERLSANPGGPGALHTRSATSIQHTRMVAPCLILASLHLLTLLPSTILTFMPSYMAFSPFFHRGGASMDSPSPQIRVHTISCTFSVQFESISEGEQVGGGQGRGGEIISLMGPK